MVVCFALSAFILWWAGASPSMADVDLMWLVGLLASSAMFPATLFALLWMAGLPRGPPVLSAAAFGVAPSGALWVGGPSLLAVVFLTRVSAQQA